MNTSSKFVVASHILVVLATNPERSIPSDFLAFSVNTNPVVIRRIVGRLRKAGLVISAPGPEGGVRLARSAAEITLLDIYQAVEEGELFHPHYTPPNQECPVGANILQCLSGVLHGAEVEMKNVLAAKTLQEITEEVMQVSGIRAMLEKGISIEELQRNYVFRNGRFIAVSG
ncbi:MAG: Rrf2 family transcriptional regulator [Calditrichia bacterium]